MIGKIENWVNLRKNISQLLFKDSEDVVVSGFVDEIRKCGKIMFIVLRDFTNKIQVFVNDYSIIELLNIKKESVIVIKGKLKQKNKTRDDDIFGNWEIVLENYEILSLAISDVPFQINQSFHDVSEEIKLKYRYLDLRKEIKNNLQARSKFKNQIENFFISKGFLEVTTPILSLSTREGANTFNTVFSLKNEEFQFSLSQSPQLYKQLLMIGGIEKYFQFSTSFRNEDLRSDRQYEFTQIDLEISYWNQSKLFKLIENMLKESLLNAFNIKVSNNFPQISYHDAIYKYGSDKPDTRFDLLIEEITENFSFSNKERIFLFNVNENDSKQFSKKLITEIFEDNVGLITKEKVIFNTKLIDENLFFQLNKFKENIKATSIFIVSNKKESEIDDLKKLGKWRLRIGHELNKFDTDLLSFCWIIDWPLFEYNNTQKKWVPAHHLFTNIKNYDFNFDFETTKSCGYDLVLNGTEIASGSERIYDPKLQKLVFEKSGMNKEEIEESFGWFLNAMKYGVPPHMGIAIGFDRLMQLILKTESIRDVIAFPKNNHGFCPMTKSPKKVR